QGNRELDVESERHAGALVTDLPRGHRLRRGVRGGADSRRLSSEALRAGAPDVQPGPRPRWNADDLRGAAVSWNRVRQRERDSRARARDRRYPRALEAAVRGRTESHGGDRVRVAAAYRGRDRLRRRLSADGADGWQ